MAHFVTLIHFTEQGVRNTKDMPERMKNRDAVIAKEGGKVVGSYLTMGEYDAVLITEFPDDAAAVRAFLTLAQTGLVRTTTMRAFGSDEQQAVMQGMS